MDSGISPVIATILLVAIAVMASVSVWFWVSPYSGKQAAADSSYKGYAVVGTYLNSSGTGCNALDIKNTGAGPLNNMVFEIRELLTGRSAGSNGTNPAIPLYINISANLLPGETLRFNLSLANSSAPARSVPQGTYKLRPSVLSPVSGLSDQIFTCVSEQVELGPDLVPWWNASFTYRQSIRLTMSANATRQNHQAKIILNASNVGANFNWSSNCNDLRLINGLDTGKLPHWVENCSPSSQNASLWVNVDQNITSSNYTIYMYYGNSTVANESDGTSTFDVFDDFNGTTLNTSKWNSWANASCAITLTGGYLRMNAAASNDNKCRIYSKTNTSYAILAYRYRMAQPYMSVFAITNATDENIWPELNTTGAYNFRTYRSGTYSTFVVFNNSATLFTVNVANPGASVWYTEQIYYGPNYQSSRRDSALLSNTTQTASNLIYQAWLSYGSAWDVAGDVNVDWVYLRKYSMPEPVSLIGAEELSWYLS